jgi:hypothetical protein
MLEARGLTKRYSGVTAVDNATNGTHGGRGATDSHPTYFHRQL